MELYEKINIVNKETIDIEIPDISGLISLENDTNKYYLLDDIKTFENNSLKKHSIPLKVFRDISTSAFVNNCFQNLMNDSGNMQVEQNNANGVRIEDRKLVFINNITNFFFQYISNEIYNNININLTFYEGGDVNSYLPPLQYNEYIFLYFKGGSLMKYFKDFFDNNIKQYHGQQNREPHNRAQAQKVKTMTRRRKLSADEKTKTSSDVSAAINAAIKNFGDVSAELPDFPIHTYNNNNNNGNGPALKRSISGPVSPTKIPYSRTFMNKRTKKLNLKFTNNAEIEKNFKVSDIDMSFKINCSSNSRFEQIKYQLLKILAKSLNKLSIILDNLRPGNDNLDWENNNKNIILGKIDGFNKKQFTQSTECYFKDLYELKSIISIVKLNLNLDEINNRDELLGKINDILEGNDYKEIILNYLVDNNLMNPDNDLKEYSCNPFENGLIIELLNYIIFSDKNNDNQKLNNELKQRVIEINNFNKHLIYNMYLKIKNMYNQNSIELAKQEIKNEIFTLLYVDPATNINTVKPIIIEHNGNYYILSKEFYMNRQNKDKLRRLINDNLQLFTDLSKKPDTVISNNNNSKKIIKIINSTETNYHFTSLNSVNNIKNNFITNFSLIRIKNTINMSDMKYKLSKDQTNQLKQLLDTLKNPYNYAPIYELIDRFYDAIDNNGNNGNNGNEQNIDNNSLSIDTEVLDITLISNYNSLVKMINDRSDTNNLSQINIYSNDINQGRVNIYNTSYILASNPINILYDLTGTLFYSTSYLCWHDAKYKKRIIRLLYYINIVDFMYNKDMEMKDKSLIYSYEVLNNLLKLIEINGNNITIPNDKLDLFIQYVKLITNNLFNKELLDKLSNSNQSIYEIINIKKNFKYIQEILSFIILFMYLLYISDERIQLDRKIYLNRNLDDDSQVGKIFEDIKKDITAKTSTASGLMNFSKKMGIPANERFTRTKKRQFMEQKPGEDITAIYRKYIFDINKNNHRLYSILLSVFEKKDITQGDINSYYNIFKLEFIEFIKKLKNIYSMFKKGIPYSFILLKYRHKVINSSTDLNLLAINCPETRLIKISDDI